MSPLKSLWKILTLHCVEATRLASESIDGPLAAGDRVALNLHTVSCRSCRRFRAQLREIHRVSLELASQVEPPTSPLPDEVRDRIKASLKGD